jgi:subfamily B ATP-binding cassette protein HlyB/CyaB
MENVVVSQQRLLIDFFSSVEILSAFNHAELGRLAERTELRTFDFGETIFTAGDPCEGLYIIQSGTVRIFAEHRGKETSMGIRKQGEVLAEVGALREYHHEYSARASSKTELLFIPRHAIAPLFAQNKDAEAFMARSAAISAAGGFVTRLFDLKGKVNKGEVEDFIRSIGIKRAKAGQTILKQNAQEDQRLYVVRQGSVRVIRHEEGHEYPLQTLGQGEIFGEKACLLRQEQMATAIAGTDTVLLVIPEKTVHFIIERNPKLKGVLEERIQFTERELQRQKKLAERRAAKRIFLDLRSKSGFIKPRRWTAVRLVWR